MIELSIVIPTCNRAPLLRKAIDSIRAAVSCAYEIVVVDGASTDGTQRVLDGLQREMGNALRVIREKKREGFVRAVNKGFRAAKGQFLIWLNDDARPLANSLDSAVQHLKKAPADVGLVALYHRCGAARSVALEKVHNGATFRLMHVRGTLYANFGLGRRELFEQLDYFDERYYVNGGDPDFSLKVWTAGLRVVPAESAFIDHDEYHDDRRADDNPRGQLDNAALFEKWQLPPKNPIRNDFDPARPCTVRGLRSALEQDLTPVIA